MVNHGYSVLITSRPVIEVPLYWPNSVGIRSKFSLTSVISPNLTEFWPNSVEFWPNSVKFWLNSDTGTNRISHCKFGFGFANEFMSQMRFVPESNFKIPNSPKLTVLTPGRSRTCKRRNGLRLSQGVDDHQSDLIWTILARTRGSILTTIFTTNYVKSYVILAQRQFANFY